MEPGAPQDVISSIPSLKALAARPLYRRFCDDIAYSKKIVGSPLIPSEVKELIWGSSQEMDKALRQYVSGFRPLTTTTSEIYLDVVGVKYPSNSTTVCAGDIFQRAVWNLRYDIGRLLVHLGMKPRTFVSAMIHAWKWPKEYHALIRNFLLFKVIDITDKCNNWPLMIAAAQNGIHNECFYCPTAEVLHELLAHGADPNARADDTGQTALMRLCSMKGCAACIRLLIKTGADIEATDDAGKRAIVHAVEAENTDAFHVLMEHKANIGFMVGNESFFDFVKKKPAVHEMLRMLRIARSSHP